MFLSTSGISSGMNRIDISMNDTVNMNNVARNVSLLVLL